MSARLVLLAGASLSVLLASAAGAQETPPPAGVATAQDTAPTAGADPAAQAGEVEELIVTAQKREQAAVDVPVTITAYTGDFLERQGVFELETLAQITPGLQVQNQSPNNPAVSIRGITSDSGEATIEPRVSLYQDGVSISKARGSYVELFDLERVEIAKGPQSTLFGRGALIGALNIIQAKADPSAFDFRASVEGGNYEQLAAEGMVNLPLGDSAAMRFAARYRHRDGYVDNALGGEDFNSVETEAYRLSFRVEPNDRFRSDLIVNYQKDQPNGTAFKSIAFSPTDPATGRVLASRRPQSAAALAPGASFEGGRPLGLNREVYGATLLADIGLSDALTLSSITAYRRFKLLEVFDADGISPPLLTAAEDAEGDQASQELRLVYDNGGRLSGFVGGGLFWEDGSQRTPAQFDERVALALLTGQLNGGAAGTGLPATTPAPAAVFANTAFTGALLRGLVAGLSGNRIVLPAAQAAAIAANLRGTYLESATNDAELLSGDLFADVTYKLNDRFELSGGVRYTADDKKTGFQSALVGAQRSVLGGVIGAGQLAGSGTAAGLAQGQAILAGLAAPNAAFIPPSAAFPLPQFGLAAQPTAGGARVREDLDDDGLTYRLVGRYALAEDLNLYASYARGRRAKVLAASAPATPGGAVRFTEVPAEKVDSVEAGFKSELLDRRLRLDGAAYYYEYDNFQTTIQQGTLFVTSNAGKAESYGAEAQANWRVGPNLDLFGTYAYNHSRFRNGVFEGNRFRLSPDHAFSLGASLRLAALGGEFDFRPQYSHRSRTVFDNDNDLPALQTVASGALVADTVQDEVQGGYGLLDARLAYSPADAPWRVELFATNILDKNYIKDAGNTGDGLGLPTFIAGSPRFYGVRLSFGLR